MRVVRGLPDWKEVVPKKEWVDVRNDVHCTLMGLNSNGTNKYDFRDNQTGEPVWMECIQGAYTEPDVITWAPGSLEGWWDRFVNGKLKESMKLEVAMADPSFALGAARYFSDKRAVLEDPEVKPQVVDEAKYRGPIADDTAAINQQMKRLGIKSWY